MFTHENTANIPPIGDPVLGLQVGKSRTPMFGGILRAGSYGAAKTWLKADAINATLRAAPPNKVLLGPPLEVDPSERVLPRPYRSTLSQLRSGYCSRLRSYLHRVGRAPSAACPECDSAPHTTDYLFSCPMIPTDLVPTDLWTATLQAAPFPQLPVGPPLLRPLLNFLRSRAFSATHTHRWTTHDGMAGHRAVSPAKVVRMLREPEVQKSVGPDRIHNHVLRSCLDKWVMCWQRYLQSPWPQVMFLQPSARPM